MKRRVSVAISKKRRKTKTSKPCKCHSLNSTQLENPEDYGVSIVPDTIQSGTTAGWFSLLLHCKKCKREWCQPFHDGGIWD
jgi:hypothetical protein